MIWTEFSGGRIPREHADEQMSLPKTSLSGVIQQYVPLAQYSTIGIGGPARYFAEVRTPRELQESLQWAGSQQLPVFILGGGSNVLCADTGFDGLVVRLALTGIEESEGSDETVVLRAAAGEDWDRFVQYAVSRNLQGIECLSGIPGTVGASPIQNVGAYGQEVKDTILKVEAIDRESGELRSFSNSECEFSYRRSRFKGRDRDRFVITSVSFRLLNAGRTALRYGDLTRYFDEAGIADPDVVQVREAVLNIRKQKAMVLDPCEPNSRSCGSFFTNPIVSNPDYERIAQLVRTEGLLRSGEKMPAFPTGEGNTKLSAAWLMERAGLQKGFRMGRVGLSERHVLAVVNFGEGSATEVLQLVKHVQATVHSRFGVHLEPEPVFLGLSA